MNDTPPSSAEWGFPSEGIEVPLRCDLVVGLAVIVALNVHVVDEPDSQKVEIPDGNPQLHTAQQEERRRHLPVNGMPFF